jgi:sigma-B regulation protein RsbU (phosphoserine phosphatase)
MQLAQMVKPQDISVLLIEDSISDATAITKAMIYGESLYSFNIMRKDTLVEGLKYAENNMVDVVLLDLNLPDAKELKAINQIHGLYPELPIVVISGYSDIDIIHQALHSGAQEFLLKGECSGAAIRQSVYQAIARKRIEKSYREGDKL